jgi:ubiquinone/menaquinone biosynthesis C-methylase UbiE
MTRRRALARVAVLALVAAVGCAARASDDATARHAFDDVEHWARIFDDPGRDAWQKPAAVVEALALRPGAAVADLGAGTGYFMPHLARAVGEAGTVYAVDTEPNLLAHLRERADRAGLDQVVPVLASPDRPRLPSASLDVLLIVDTYHHVDDRVAYFRAAARLLRAGGRVVVIDWQKRDLPVGPPADHKLARRQVEDEMRRAGYRLAAAPDLLPYQYVLVFEPAEFVQRDP